jgi:hypothetical protein
MLLPRVARWRVSNRAGGNPFAPYVLEALKDE